MKVAMSILTVFVLAITVLGVVLQASVSPVEATSIYNDQYHFFKNQCFFFALAFAGAVIVSNIPFDFWFSKKILIALIAFIFISLIIVGFTNLGHNVKGSSRWISLFGFRLQPSEFVKVFSILIVSWWMGNPALKVKSFFRGILIPIFFILMICGLLLKQPDLGSTLFVFAVNAVVMIVAGVNFYYVLFAIVAFVIAVTIFVLYDPTRLARVLPIIDLNMGREITEAVRQDELLQVLNSISAFSSGGIWGKGLGQSIYKQHYLPEYHTDFVFAILAEELGICATIICLLMYLGIFICGMYISCKTKDFRLRLVAFGMTFLLGLSAITNLGVVLGLLPTKGLAMPLLSYGGSNLLSSYLTVAFIIAVGKRNLLDQRFEGLSNIRDDDFWND